MTDSDQDNMRRTLDEYYEQIETSATGQAREMDADRSYDERIEYWRDEVPHPLVGEYDELLEEGCSPKIASATLRYISGLINLTTPCTQPEICDEYGCAEMTLRRWADVAWENLPFEGPDPLMLDNLTEIIVN